MTRSHQKGLTLIEIAIAGVVIVVVLSLVLLSARPTRVIGVSTTSISVPAGGQTTFTATLLYKGWGWGTPAAVGGTVSHTSGNIVQVTPATATTTNAAPNQTLTVVGAVAGTGTITVQGSSGGETHNVAVVSVTVTAPN